MLSPALALVAAVTLLPAAHSPARHPASLDDVTGRVRPNDNRTPAGTMRGGVLVLRLVARRAVWHPEGDDRPGAPIQAFAEEGKAARIPGPMMRVRAGTEVEVVMRNALPDTLVVHGLHPRDGTTLPAEAPLLALAPGERRTVRFRLGAPGTFYYWGTTTRRPIDFRTRDDSQLTGAIIVDPPGRRPTDRIMVIGLWSDTVHRSLTHRERLLAVINGRAWPNTERIRHTVGDTVRWRVINGTADLHPMHLHGFYFRVDSRGDSRRNTLYASSVAGLGVTEAVPPGGTTSLTWIPERPGNWLFHCHVPEHIAPRGPLGTIATHSAAHIDHATDGMGGMVIGVTVRPRTGAPRVAAAAPDERRIRLLVRPNLGGSADRPFYSYALHEGGAEPAPDSGIGIAPTLDLVRGHPVRITVVNRLPEATAVHWHGIELESYFDGVPGFSGAGRRLTPLIAPRDSFVVRFTPPRAGTFIYHTHADELRQQLAGLAGPLVVSEPGAPRDPALDIPVLISAPSDASRAGTVALLNGSEAPAPLRMTAGTTYRLRLIQISAVRSFLRVQLSRDGSTATWRPVAKDGAELPDAARVARPSWTTLGVGETLDVEVIPSAGGPMRLEVRSAVPGAVAGPLATLPIVVR